MHAIVPQRLFLFFYLFTLEMCCTILYVTTLAFSLQMLSEIKKKMMLAMSRMQIVHLLPTHRIVSVCRIAACLSNCFTASLLDTIEGGMIVLHAAV